ncbi:hypothetical protein LTR11_004465 [Exophiala xenobiotica]|nr:hypothetical protein LTS06_009579 [Exophiala xenobiotica]KAK5297436.1 hypothetical protein LTR14_003167 [Exophiala xenobiotica]KAK5356649.1 hypothetical protein LTR61_000384 [Exophiala xenobiotica]KAK5376801.1 hypothetical protein LTR11_004465 [Exophiala xenobiotica]KAK5406611.1 hypothetical protein LTR06_008105 [Exophiala xenobiotica]
MDTSPEGMAPVVCLISVNCMPATIEAQICDYAFHTAILPQGLITATFSSGVVTKATSNVA